jgi:hypothetical protein
MKWKDTVASQCRWSEFAEENWGDWDFLWEESEADYQGHAEFIAYKDGKFVHVYWNYGSCGGCDPWEDISEEEAKKEFNDGAVYFDDFQQLKDWIEMKSKGKRDSMMAGVWEQAFYHELEEVLKR